MPTQLLTRVNWDLIYPPFTRKCFELAARCQDRGVDYYAISGHRSFKEQAVLYFQGRTLPGRIVTKAKPGFSTHNYGLGIDWCKDKDVSRAGLQPDWDLGDYQILRQEAEKLGLESGMSWKLFKEGPHVQLPLQARGVKFEDLKREFERSGGQLQAVWDCLDRIGGW